MIDLWHMANYDSARPGSTRICLTGDASQRAACRDKPHHHFNVSDRSSHTIEVAPLIHSKVTSHIIDVKLDFAHHHFSLRIEDCE